MEFSKCEFQAFFWNLYPDSVKLLFIILKAVYGGRNKKIEIRVAFDIIRIREGANQNGE